MRYWRHLLLFHKDTTYLVSTKASYKLGKGNENGFFYCEISLEFKSDVE